MVPKPPVIGKKRKTDMLKTRRNFASGGKIAINRWENVKSQSEFFRRVWKSKRVPKAVQKRPPGWIWDDFAPKKVLPQAAEFVLVT